jgi:hypothetical protein
MWCACVLGQDGGRETRLLLNQVRKAVSENGLFTAIYTLQRSFYQDRLGTNIGKTQLQGHFPQDRDAIRGRDHDHLGQDGTRREGHEEGDASQRADGRLLGHQISAANPALTPRADRKD